MKRRQEQETARSEVVEVGPNVLRMELPIRLPGLGHVNCYALLDREGAALVDPGLPGPGTWRAIRRRLGRAGLRVRDVHTILVTHSHPDHFGGAARFAKEAGAEVVAHGNFRFGFRATPHSEVSVEDLEGEAAAKSQAETVPRSPGQPSDVFRHWSGPSPWGGTNLGPNFRRRLRWRLLGALGGSFVPRISKPVEDGDVLKLAGREWFVVYTPGHTDDHVCFHDPETGLFLAGDHVLPTITPHISGLSPVADPLDAFFESLERVGEIEGVGQVLPAHGHPFSDLRARTEAIRRHHHERLDKVKAIGRELGAASVQRYSQRLFKPQSWGSMAESETYAHLEHLRHAGEADRHTDASGAFLYETG